MENKLAIAKTKYISVSPFKLRRIADLVRRKPVTYAIGVLNNMSHKSSRVLLKSLNSAIANANDKYSIIKENLVISYIVINEGPRHKRQRPRARGRMDILKRRISHVEIHVEEKK